MSRDPGTELDVLAERLTLAVTDAARVSRAVRQSWWDAHGQELADRIALAGREVGRQAEKVAGMARDVVTLLTPQPDDEPPTGPRLPGLDGRRVSEARGVRLPLLGAEDPGEPDGPP